MHASSLSFSLNAISFAPDLQAKINYTLTLDVTRQAPNYRAYISPKIREETNTITLRLQEQCFSHNFFIEVGLKLSPPFGFAKKLSIKKMTSISITSCPTTQRSYTKNSNLAFR